MPDPVPPPAVARPARSAGSVARSADSAGTGARSADSAARSADSAGAGAGSAAAARPERRWSVPALVTGTALLLAVAFLLAPPMGTDLAAQVARADFVDRHGTAPVDLGWYGGVHQFGYSLLTAGLGALFGVRMVGAVAAVVSAAALGWLFVRHRARRPLLAGVLGAIVLVGNLASGRITFAVGLALGLLALVAVSADRPSRPLRLALAALLAALATWASPVAGLFTGLAGAALLLAGLRRGSGPGRPLPGGWRADRPLGEALTLCTAPAVALAPMAVLFGNGGTQPYTAESMRINVALTVLVFAMLPRRRRVLRTGAALTVLLLVGAYYLPTPIGSNALRLPMLFALPVLAGYAALPTGWLAALLAATVWWQNPVMTSDLGRAGSPESSAAFYRPLADELARRAPVGRVEVVPLRDHWESAYLPSTVPLARGWERQVDTDRNALFYRTGLDADTYADWLRDNAVQYVALAPDSVPDRWAREEAALVDGGLPYLRQVWADDTWRLYAVTDPTPLVAVPGRLVAADPGGVRFTAPTAAGDLVVRVRWSRWLSLEGPGGCLTRGPDDWVTVRVEAAGEYRLTSALRPRGGC
ncbi:hypothetical protein GA0074692_0245 [Micromonospora pallida]|uniref:4-amino-4-deoxy-L-arabinose transferase n=1 Tax=Micromonospora pallida TaxID=145854 RepID=A0A1C6RKQ1_9ACTN|nr:hypothetical protein [Micromonospora pallida]SCL17752.1 hypothetical protein GA0074692_0245 [Micromonospora pallida]